jgi:hypothetical protein
LVSLGLLDDMVIDPVLELYGDMDHAFNRFYQYETVIDVCEEGDIRGCKGKKSRLGNRGSCLQQRLR